MTVAGKTVLVTGATGFVGGAMALQLAAAGTQVKALVRSPEKSDFLKGIDGIQFVEGDLLDPESLAAAVQNCDYVFHSAAALGGKLEYQRQVNVDGTRNLMKAAAGAGVQRVVHISTISVYGFQYPPGGIREDMGPKPGLSAYSISKSEAEAVVRQTGVERNLSYTIIRPGAIYGPRSRAWTGRLFRLAKRKPTIFLGSGNGCAPIIYIDDLVDLCSEAASHPAADGQAYNAVVDPPPTWRQFLGCYSKLAGHQSWLGIPVGGMKFIARIVAAFSPASSINKELPDWIDYVNKTTSFRMDKARQDLGWTPQVDLETGVQKCVPWLKEQGMLD